MKILRITPIWDIKLETVTDPSWRKTGDIKIDPDDRKAILLLNTINPKQENLEEVIVHELLHIKLYPLDQVCYSLITSNFEELTKCFLLAFGENKQFSYGRCAGMKSYNELFDGLKPLE